MIYKKLLILSAVAVVSYATTNFNFVNSQASLTPPENFNYGYYWSTSLDTWVFYDGDELHEDPAYIRQGSSSPWSYDLILDKGNYNGLRNGLEILIKFITPNVGDFTSTSPYYPREEYIGTDGTIGSVRTIEIVIYNETPYDYQVLFDKSSSGLANYYISEINGLPYAGIYDALYLAGSENLNKVIAPAFSELKLLESANSQEEYFDALYIREIGVSAAYNEGYDAGLDDLGYDAGLADGLAAAPIQSIFTSIFGGIAEIFNINIFGGISLGTIILAPIAVSLLWFILGIVSGVGGKR
jgi:hypothetical protein